MMRWHHYKACVNAILLTFSAVNKTAKKVFMSFLNGTYEWGSVLDITLRGALKQFVLRFKDAFYTEEGVS